MCYEYKWIDIENLTCFCCARLLFVLVWKRETNNRMHILFSKILQILSLLRKGINESLGNLQDTVGIFS
jgi:hypothetical protein